MAQSFFDEGYGIGKILSFCDLAKSSFYYKPKQGRQGRSVYGQYYDANGHILTDHQLLKAIEKLFENPFVDYGYYKVYIYLSNELHYKVSKNKVYKIMGVNNLINKRYVESSKKRSRNWVKDLIPKAETPFDYWEFDLKYVYIHGKKKNALVLSIIDVFSRWNLGQKIAFSIKEKDVIALFDTIFKDKTLKLPPQIRVRSDNGSQFIAHQFQLYLKEKQVYQEFTFPATPQQDAHIESYHSIMEGAICQRFEFMDIAHFRSTMQQFRLFYNHDRIHSGIGYISPFKFLLKQGINMQ